MAVTSATVPAAYNLIPAGSGLTIATPTPLYPAAAAPYNAAWLPTTQPLSLGQLQLLNGAGLVNSGGLAAFSAAPPTVGHSVTGSKSVTP